MLRWAVFFHVIIAVFWVGGMFFTAAVLVPATRKRLSEHKTLLFKELGTRFSRISWILFPFLILTGFLALVGRGFPHESFMSLDFWKTAYGGALFAKIHLFAFVLIVSGIHDFWLGPKAVKIMADEPGSPKGDRFRKASSWIGRINMAAGLLILFYAITMVR